MTKFFLSTVLMLQTFTLSNVGGGNIPNELISERIDAYNNAIRVKKAIAAKEKLRKEIIAKKNNDLSNMKYQISRYLRKVDRKLYWSNYTRVISRLESSGRYHVKNRYGYLGKYQISKHYINDLGFEGSDNDFLKDKIGQELVMAKYTYRNMYAIKKFDLQQYIGEEINGIKVTMFGMMASAHLVGIKNLMEYLDSYGETIHKDGNDTSIEKYMKAFA